MLPRSLLAYHPRASVVATIVTPNMGHKFRYSNSNALTQFERYEKLGRDVTTLSAFAAFVHSCSFFGHQGAVKTKAGVETTWEDVVVALVHQHQPWMNQRAACQQNWYRSPTHPT